MKVKIFEASKLSLLEQKINEFIHDLTSYNISDI